MGAVMLRSSDAMLRRFSTAERWTHRLIALDVTLLIVTAAFLYIPAISALVGNRYLFKISHSASVNPPARSLATEVQLIRPSLKCTPLMT